MNDLVYVLVFILWAAAPPIEINQIQEYPNAAACWEVQEKIDLADLGRATCISKGKRNEASG